MATTIQPDTVTAAMKQHLDSGGRDVMLVKERAVGDPVSYSGDFPFWNVDLYGVAVPDATDPAAEPRVVCELKQARLKLSRRRAAMPYTWRRIDAEELHFVHRGGATFVTECGQIDAPPGRFVFINRGIGYRVLPKDDDFMSLIFESRVRFDLDEDVGKVDIPILRPTLPVTAEAPAGTTQWEERLRTESWSLNVVHRHDPVRSLQLGEGPAPVFALDVETVPAHSPTAPRPGLPFVIFRGPDFHLEVVMPRTPMPFFHRNVRANETQFVHFGTGDRESLIGHIDAPLGSLVNYPKGVEHRTGDRKGSCIGLIWETSGDVALGEGIRPR